MAKLETKPLDWFHPDPNQPRKEFNSSDLRLLGDSLLVRQNDPLQAFSDGLLIDGERRLRAAKLVGMKSLDVIVTDAKLTETQIRVVRLCSFFHKADLSAYEKWLACSELLCGNPHWQLKDLAETLKVDPSSVSRYLSPSKTSPAWQDALRDGKVGLSDVYQASLLTSEREQAELLRHKMNGASRDEIAGLCRRKRRSGVPGQKVRRVKIALPAGVQIVISGKDLTLEDVIASLTEARRQALKASNQNLDAKTWAAAVRCQSQKGCA